MEKIRELRDLFFCEFQNFLENNPFLWKLMCNRYAFTVTNDMKFASSFFFLTLVKETMNTFMTWKETIFAKICHNCMKIWINLRKATCVMAINSNVLKHIFV